jgi:outer membrane receptor for ferrienterochelin and colicin
MTFRSAVLLLGLTIGTTSILPAAEEAAEQREERAETPVETGIEVDAGAASVTSALQGKEGVRIQTLCTHCNSANVQVGGLSSDLVPIEVDGYPVFGGLATSMIFGILPADTVADAQIAKGPGAAVAPGRAAGGVIRLTESTPEELPRIDYSGELGSFDRARAVLRVAGPLGGRASGRLVAGQESADAVDGDDDGINDVGALDRTFFEGRLDVEVGRDHRLDFGFSWIDEDSTNGRGKYDLLADLLDLADRPVWVREDTLLEREEYRAGWEWRLGQGRTLNLRLLADDRDTTLRDQETRYPVPGFDTSLEDRLVINEKNEWGSIAYRHPIGLKHRFTAGVETRDQDVTALDVVGPDFFEDTVDSWSAFVDFDTRLGSMLNLEVGIRHDDAEWGAVDLDSFRSKSRTQPRATLSLRPAGGVTLKLIAGGTFRVPRPIFTEVCCGQQPVRNADTAPEFGTGVGLEGIYQPSPDLRVSFWAARTDFDDHILRLVGRSDFYQPVYAVANVGEARAETAEAAVRWSPLEWLTLDASAGWLSFENRGDRDVPVEVSRPTQTVLVPIDDIPYLPERTASLAATFSLPRQIELSGQANYTGSMLIQQYDSDIFAFPLLLDELRETPDFWLVNLAVRAPLPADFELVVGVDNLTDEVQDDMDDPTTDYNWGPLVGRTWRAGLRFTYGGG